MGLLQRGSLAFPSSIILPLLPFITGVCSTQMPYFLQFFSSGCCVPQEGVWHHLVPSLVSATSTSPTSLKNSLLCWGEDSVKCRAPSLPSSPLTCNPGEFPTYTPRILNCSSPPYQRGKFQPLQLLFLPQKGCWLLAVQPLDGPLASRISGGEGLGQIFFGLQQPELQPSSYTNNVVCAD